MTDPLPLMVILLVISGKPLGPSVSLSTEVRVNVLPSRFIVSATPLPFAVLIALIRHATLPEEQLNTAALAIRGIDSAKRIKANICTPRVIQDRHISIPNFPINPSPDFISCLLLFLHSFIHIRSTLFFLLEL
jgi:hypothetical protein